MSEPWDEHELVFVGGLHRSGTTLVAKLLAGFDGVSGLSGTEVVEDEGQFLQTAFPLGSEYGGVTAWALDRRSHLEPPPPSQRRAIAEHLWTSWKPYWDLDRRFLVEKTPLNLTKGRYLQALFPGARFVMVVRNPVVQALAVEKWSPTVRGKLGWRLEPIVANWFAGMSHFSEDRRHLDRVHLVHYEELVHDPRVTLARLAQFVGTTPGASGPSVDSRRSTSYEQVWNVMSGRRSALPAGSSGASLRGRARERLRAQAARLQRAQAARIRERFGGVAGDWGYDFDDLSRWSQSGAPDRG